MKRDDLINMDPLHNDDVDNLLKVFSSLNDTDELYAFLQDLFTIREIQETSQRLSVARMLDEGHSYTSIADETGASATTIARVSKCLNYGAGGYRAALDILEGETIEDSQE